MDEREWTQATYKMKNVMEFKSMPRIWLLYSNVVCVFLKDFQISWHNTYERTR